MPIYHVHISSGSRADGQSAAVKVAYILREGAYGGRDDLVCWGSGCMPSWAAADPRQLFEAADLYERSNGRLFLHVWVALPNELTAAERHELGLAIAAALTAAGLPFVYAVHAGDPKSPGEPANPHIHIVISERINDNIPRDARQWFRRANRRDPARGGAAKDRRLKEVTWVDDSRRVVARLTNEHLKVAGCKARVTADSHEVRIVEAEAWGDTETADVLRRHPPGVHLGPAAAAIERDRSGGKRDEAPKVLRQGEPTERGDLARAKAAEEDRVRGELERVSAKLRRAREEEVRATESVASARSAGVSDDRILAVYEESESTAEGSGWAAVEEAASSKSGRKKKAEAAAALLGIDVESVVRVALEEDADPVVALEAAVASFEAARSALLSDEAIEGIRCEAESGELGSGWAAVAEAARRRLAWKARAEPAAREAGIADVEVVYAAALSRGEDPLAALESVTAARLERKKQAENAAGETGIIDIETEYGRARDVGEDPLSMLERATNVVVAARAALVTDETIQAQHAAAESRERGSGWRAVEKASQTRSAWKGRAEASARAAGIVDVEAVYAAALSRGEDPLAALESVTAARLERKKQAENAAGETGIIDIETEYGRARDVGEDPLSMLERATNVVVAARAALVTDETIQAQHAAAESRERGSGWRAVEKASQTRSAWKGRAEASARAAGIADVEAVYAAALSRGEDPLAALESVTAARLERKKQAENAAGETGIIDIETEYGRARDVGEDPLSMLERATNVVVAARAALVTDETIQAQHAAAESRERGSGWRAVEKASQTRSAWKGRAEASARAAGIADVEAVYAAALSRGEDPLAALEAATAARQAAARRRAAVEGREAVIRATRVGADWLLEAEQRVLRAADRRPTLEEREGIAETVERRIREHLDSRLEALAVTDAGAELLEEMQADASAATLAAQERVIELAAQRLKEHLAEQQRLFAQPVGEDLFTAHLAARDPAWRPGGRTTAENRTAALRAAEAEGARRARARDVFGNRWSRRHYRSAAGALGERFTLADVDAALTAAESFAGRVAGLSEGTGLAVLTEAVAAGGELTVADLEAAVERAEQAERQAARREALSAGGRELYAVRLAALAAADQRAGETPSGAVVDQALDETESDEARLPRLDALFEDAELRSYYRGTLGPARDQHQVTLEQLDEALRAAEAVRARRNTVLQYPGGDQHLSGAALWAAERKSLSPDEGAAVETPLAAFEAALERVESRLEKRVQQAADEVERLLPTTQPYSHGRPDFRVPALGDERLEELGQLRLEPADALVEATVAELRERYARRARYDTPDKLRYSPQDRLKSEGEHLGGVVEMRYDREFWLWSPSSTSPQPTRSSALARVVKKYVLEIWEIVLVACDKILGGDLGERLRRRREQIEKAADVAERLLPTILIFRASPVPVAGEAGLAGVVTDTTAPVVGDAVEVVWARYYRRSLLETPSERRYSAVERDLAAKEYLAFSLEVAEARQQREGASVLPTLDDARAIVLLEHESNLREMFAVACDEVFGPGELATRWRRRRDRVRDAVDVVEAGLQTTGVGWPDRDVPALSHETLIALAAAEADPHRRAMWRELGERYRRCAGLGTPYEHRYSADDRTEAERAYLAVAFKMAQGRHGRGWVRSLSSAALPPPAPTRASVLEEHRSNLREIFAVACEEVSGAGELGERRRPRRDEVRRAVDAAEAALPTTQPHPVVRRNRRVPALSHATWDALFDVETDPFRKAMWRELGERYHRLADSNTPYDQYYNAEDRKQSEQAHLNEVSTKKYERDLQTWRSSTRESARPTPADAEASVLKDHQAEISGIFTTARDKVLRADAVRPRRQEEPDRPVGTSKAARGDAVPVSEGSSAGSLQPKAEIAGARQAQASSREEKPAPAAAEPPTPDVVELVAKDSEQNVLPIFNGTLAVSNGQLDDIEYCIGNNRDAGYEVALEAVERIRQVHQHDAAARAAAETAHYAPAARKRRWRKLLSSATEELMWEMAIEHAGKITDVCRERLGLRDDGDTGGGAPPSPKRLEPPDPGAAGSGGGPSVKTPAPLPPADGDRGPRR